MLPGYFSAKPTEGEGKPFKVVHPVTDMAVRLLPKLTGAQNIQIHPQQRSQLFVAASKLDLWKTDLAQ